MNIKSFAITVLVVWIVFNILATILNVVILNWDIMPGARPSDMMGAMEYVFISLGALVFSVFFTLIFVKGQEGKGIAEGVRYGLYVGLLIYLTEFLMNYATVAMPPSLLWGYHWGMMVISVVLGITAAVIYKPTT